MYTIFAILLAAGLGILTVLGFGGGRRGKLCFVWNLALSAAGLLGVILVPLIARAMVFGGNHTEEWKSWAWDAFSLFLKTTLPFLGISLLLICLTMLVTVLAERSSAADRKRRVFSAVIRQAFSMAASVLFLLLAPFYSVMAETDEAMLHVLILLFGVAEAMLMRLTLLFEALVGKNR